MGTHQIDPGHELDSALNQFLPRFLAKPSGSKARSRFPSSRLGKRSRLYEFPPFGFAGLAKRNVLCSFGIWVLRQPHGHDAPALTCAEFERLKEMRFLLASRTPRKLV